MTDMTEIDRTNLNTMARRLSTQHASLEKAITEKEQEVKHQRKQLKVLKKSLKKEKRRLRSIRPEIDTLINMAHDVAIEKPNPTRADIGRVRGKANDIQLTLNSRKRAYQFIVSSLEGNPTTDPPDHNPNPDNKTDIPTTPPIEPPED
jgi:nitrate/nitrite-specific signal transduction histidine kinase